MKSLKAAIERVGLQKAAEQIGVSPQAICNWQKRRKIPAERVLDVERVTGVSRHELRPDLYPRAA